jgi:hypothetical protein
MKTYIVETKCKKIIQAKNEEHALEMYWEQLDVADENWIEDCTTVTEKKGKKYECNMLSV